MIHLAKGDYATMRFEKGRIKIVIDAIGRRSRAGITFLRIESLDGKNRFALSIEKKDGTCETIRGNNTKISERIFDLIGGKVWHRKDFIGKGRPRRVYRRRRVRVK